MNRTFDKTEITYICEDVTKSIEACKECMQDILDDVDALKLEGVMVPAEAATQDITYEAEAFSIVVDNREDDISNLKNKLTICKERVDEIIREDKEYAEDAKDLKTQIDAIAQVAENMKGFMEKTSFDKYYDTFMVSFATASTKWHKTLDNTQGVVDQIKANTKGSKDTSVAFSRDPVNLSTGNFIYYRDDLTIKGNPPFIFGRFYNAINHRSGSLGKDWNHNYEVKLLDDAAEKVLILEDGKEERFLKVSGNTYSSLYQSDGTLEFTDNGYLYKTTDQDAYYFDADGYFLRLETNTGSKTVLHYKETKHGKCLVKVERATGEAFSLSYSDDGYLHQVTDHSGRTITYQMSGDKLIGIRTPNEHWCNYSYSNEGKLDVAGNASGIDTVANTYDEHRRITYQKFADGTSMTFQYDDKNRSVKLIERDESEVTYVHDDRYRDIKHIHHNGTELFEYNEQDQKVLSVDKAGNKTRYDYDYNEKGNLTKIVNPLGNKLELSYESHNQVTALRVNGQIKVQNKYNAVGDIIETTDALGNTYRIEYLSKGRPERVYQPDGSMIFMTYDERGNITDLTDASGSNIQYRYDILNRVSQSVDGNGNVTAYEYDLEDNLIRVTNANGDTRSYEYNKSNRMTKIIDFDGSETRREYNEINRPCKLIDQLGQETHLLYDRMWNLARITEPNGAKTTYLYNEDNLLGRVRNANDDIVRYKYDAVGNCIEYTDEEGHVTGFSYDAVGQLTTVKDPEGHETSYQYNGEGNLTQIVDALGNKTTLCYDVNGNLITELGSIGEERHYTFTTLGMIESITDEAGRKTCYQYECGGRLKAITYPDQTTEVYTYDGNGNVKSHTDKKGYTLHYTYNSLNQVIVSEGSSAEGVEGIERTEYTYDSVGNVTSMTDGLGNRTVYEYTPFGKLRKVIDALGNQTEYNYDICNRLIEIRQSENVTKYGRDLSGNIISITNPAGQQETYRYNKRGELLEKIDKEGYLTQYSYTPRGDVAHIQYADGREIKMSYNPLRQLQQIHDWLGITKIESDAAGRATSITYPDGNQVSYTYGVSGERKTITYPDGKTAHYSYDQYLRLSELRDNNGVIHYGYNQWGGLIHKQFSEGIETNYQYNTKGQLTSLLHQDQEGILDSYRYQYDLLGNKSSILLQRRDLPDESGSYNYHYDAIGRLAEVQKDSSIKSNYGYDAYGNRISSVRLDTSGGMNETTYHYNALNQLIRKVDSGSEEVYKYDSRGNLTQVIHDGKVKNEYLYGAFNRLEQAINDKREIVQYTYHGLGHRIGKQTGTIKENLDPLKQLGIQSFESLKKIDFTVDFTREYNNLLQSREVGAEDNKIQTYLWDAKVTSIHIEGYQKGGKQLAHARIASHAHLLLDNLGSPLRFIDESGILKETYGYDEFGQELYPKEGNALQPFTYTGYQKDSIADTYYAQAREYHPANGRFVSEDIIKGYIEAPFTLNQYSYCWNQPLRYVDLNGMYSNDDTLEGEERGGIYTEPINGHVNGPGFYVKGTKLFGKKYGNMASNNQSSLDRKSQLKNTPVYGLSLFDIGGGIARTGYYDNKGIWKAKYELEGPKANVGAGFSNKFAGVSAKASLITASTKVRVIEVFGKRIFIGGALDLFSVGLQYGYSAEDNNIGFGAGFGVGVSMQISWDDIEESIVEC